MRMGGWSRRRSLAAAVVAVAVVAGTAAAGALGSGAASVTVVANLGSDWTDLDVQVQAGTGNLKLPAGPYDRLLYLANGKYYPYLGTVISKTATAVTFRIRQDAVCQDGTKLTTEDVLASFKAMIERPKLNNFLPNYFGPGPYAVSANPKQHTFTLRVGTPYQPILGGFAGESSIVLCRAGTQALTTDPNAIKEKTYGTGPYEIVSATHGDQVVFKLRPEWKWGPVINGKQMTAKDLADNWIWKIVPNSTTAANLMLTGGLDILVTDGANVDRLKADSGLQVLQMKNYIPQLLLFNMRRPVVQPDAIRDAMMNVVIQKDYRQACCNGYGTLTPSLQVPGGDCFDKSLWNLLPQGGVAKAKDVLAKGGYTYRGSALYDPSGNPVKLELLGSTSFGLGPEYVLNQLRSIGIDATLSLVDPATYGARALRGQYDVNIGGSAQAVPDAGQRWALYYGPTPEDGGTNNAWVGAGDKVLYREIRLGLGTTGAESCKHFVTASKIYLQKHYFLPLRADDTLVVYRKSLIRQVYAGYRNFDATNTLVKK
jgi:peptide/nickel transport system substrate-binding protein